MKKKKWSVGLYILLAKTIIDIIIVEKIAEKNTVYVGAEPISDYIDKSIGYGFALALIVIVGTGTIMLNAIKHGSPDIKYHFWTAKLFGFLNGVLLMIKGIIYDVKILAENRLIAQANGDNMK